MPHVDCGSSTLQSTALQYYSTFDSVCTYSSTKYIYMFQFQYGSKDRASSVRRIAPLRHWWEELVQ